MKRVVVLSILVAGLVVVQYAASGAITVQPTVIGQEMHRVRYNLTSLQAAGAIGAFDSTDQKANSASGYKYRSPGKAFALSLAVPGLGQWYYGNKIKAVGFAGLEAAMWVLHFKYHSDGNKATTAFEEFNRQYWSRDRYSDYLNRVYGDTTDKNIDSTEISHHLPDTYTGQYYEMTGKYDQFSWGWDDAVFGGHTLAELGYTPPRIVTPDQAPSSSHRDIYENMRHDANNKFDKARAVVYAALVNHVVSAFEAYITTKRHNSNKGGTSKGDPFSSRWKFDGKLKSVYARNDTPYFKVTYKF